jgi:hypothetical protein
MCFLFFFCLLGCTGCKNWGEKANLENEMGNQKTREQVETVGPIKEKYILVLTYGDVFMKGVAKTICDSIGAVHYTLDQNETDREAGNRKAAVKDADYILLGTTKPVSELEFKLRNHLEKEELEGKKMALFIINQQEEPEEYEKKLLEWCPDMELLPTFTMETKENLQDELGRMNGWLTSVMTYGMLEE